MNPPSKFRAGLLLAILFVAAVIVIAREHRPSFLRPGLRLYAYVSTADNAVSVVDLVKLATVAHVPVGGAISAMREHPTRAEVWGVSSSGGFAWVLDSRTSQIVARVPVGALPYSMDFSPDGRRLYVPASGNNTLTAIDCSTRQVVAQSATGKQPVAARISPDGKLILVLNKKDATAGIYDAATLQLRGTTINVIPDPEDATILNDNSAAFILSRTQRRLSVIDLRKGLLLTNLELAGIPSQMILKPDGGELYVVSPESHGLQAINTWTHEVGDYLVLGSAPTRGALLADTGELFVSDAASGNVTPVDVTYRRVNRPIPAGQVPGALRFDPGDKARLLLVVSQGSGDLSIIRVASDRASGLLTMIPVGEQPRELAVKLF